MNNLQFKHFNSNEELDQYSPAVGELVNLCDKLYIWTGTEYSEVQNNTQSKITMTAYDINKQLVAQMPDLTDKEINRLTYKALTDLYIDTKNNYYMLLCNDLKYYTIFHVRSKSNELFEDVFIECVQNVGQIKSIDYKENAVEVWITKDEEAYVMYLFPYDQGVIECL